VLRHEPIWMFHGADDPVVSPKQSVLLFEALKAVDGDVRFWEYAGVKHNAWDRAYGNAELPHWLLSHSLSTDAHITPVADRILVPIHPVPARVNPEVYDAYVGEYEGDGRLEIRVFRDGDQLYQRGRDGNVAELLPESNNTFFFPSGSTTRLTFERDPATGQVRDVLWHDDRHEERWDRMR
jgi:hypothetical protein